MLTKWLNAETLLDYDALVFPGGFSFGDYVRAGAIWAKWLVAKLGRELKAFVDDGRPILGICNGFQVLVEAGLLPAFEGIAPYPEAVLATNHPPGYNCRWIYLKHENRGKCVFTSKIPKGKVLRMPVAHAEGDSYSQKKRKKSFWRGFTRTTSLFSDTATGMAIMLRALSHKPQRLLSRYSWNLQSRRHCFRFNAPSGEGLLLVAAARLD
jgi:phosphoribosylformylglycinamidine (FGAM) synthase-like amidotransferase family enzyme